MPVELRSFLNNAHSALLKGQDACGPHPTSYLFIQQILIEYHMPATKAGFRDTTAIFFYHALSYMCM